MILSKNKLIKNKNKWKSSHWCKYLFKRYTLRHIPPDKLHYVLVVWHKVKWSVGQQKLYDQPLNQW